MRPVRPGVIASLFAVILPFSTTAVAQQNGSPPASIEWSDIPIWSVDGTAPAKYPGNFVFLDPTSGDLVVSYASSLGLEAPGSGSRNTFRVVLPCHVRPKIDARVTRLAPTRYEYHYTLSNGPSAHAAITRWIWKVSLPQSAETKVPAYWRASGQTGAACGDPADACVSFEWTGPQDLLDDVEHVTSLLPGRTIPEFRVLSSSRPGFLRTYFQGGAVTRQYGGTLPAAVEEQLQETLSLEHTGWPAVILGPKYAAEIPNTELARDLLVDVNMLEAQDLISSSDAFVREVTKLLEHAAATGDARAASTGPTKPVGAIRSSPATALEKQLLWVIQVNFGKASLPLAHNVDSLPAQ